MKKIQVLGNSLSKDEQRKISGGKNGFKVTCTCNDGAMTSSCNPTSCAGALANAQAACTPHGGFDTCFICTNNCM
ncbi:MAG: hypothetical protein QM737_23575 [Ferruginibacter sp.]